MLTLPWCPESPRFLYIKKKDEQAAIKGIIEIYEQLQRNGSYPLDMASPIQTDKTYPHCECVHVAMTYTLHISTTSALRQLRGNNSIEDELQAMKV